MGHVSHHTQTNLSSCPILRNETQKASQGPSLKVVHCHFSFILLAKQVTDQPRQESDKIDPTFWWEKLQNHGKEHGHLQKPLTEMINAIKLPHSQALTKIKPMLLQY